MSEKPKPLPKDLLEAVEKFDRARAEGKRPLLQYDAVNFGKGYQLNYSDDDTRRAINPCDEIADALGGE